MGMHGRPAGALAVIAMGIAFAFGASGASAQSDASVGPCAPQTAQGVCFGMPPAPTIIRQLQFNNVPKGSVMVVVNGSGHCENASTTADEVADFQTQIVDNPNATPNYRQAGGLRINNRIPRAATPGVNKIVPFSLSSSRLFTYTTDGAHNFSIKLKTIKLDAHVACYAYTLNMTAIAIPD